MHKRCSICRELWKPIAGVNAREIDPAKRPFESKLGSVKYEVSRGGRSRKIPFYIRSSFAQININGDGGLVEKEKLKKFTGKNSFHAPAIFFFFFNSSRVIFPRVFEITALVLMIEMDRRLMNAHESLKTDRVAKFLFKSSRKLASPIREIFERSIRPELKQSTV